jgi:hypothetical protein
MDDARRVWEGMDRPSGRRVATRLSQAGLEANYRTIYRRHEAGRTVPSSRLLFAAERLDDASSVLTRAPSSTADDVGSFTSSPVAHPDLVARRCRLGDRTDAELAHQVARQLCINVLTLSEVLQKNAEKLVLTKPEAVGQLLSAMSRAVFLAVQSLVASRRIRALGDAAGPPPSCMFVAGSDQLEQHIGLGLILADVDDVIKDQEVILVELGECTFKREFAACDLQALTRSPCSHEQYAPGSACCSPRSELHHQEAGCKLTTGGRSRLWAADRRPGRIKLERFALTEGLANGECRVHLRSVCFPGARDRRRDFCSGSCEFGYRPASPAYRKG